MVGRFQSNMGFDAALIYMFICKLIEPDPIGIEHFFGQKSFLSISETKTYFIIHTTNSCILKDMRG